MKASTSLLFSFLFITVMCTVSAHAYTLDDEAPDGTIYQAPLYDAVEPCNGDVLQWMSNVCGYTRGNTGYVEDAWPAVYYLWKTDCYAWGGAFCNGGGFITADNTVNNTTNTTATPDSEEVLALLEELTNDRLELKAEIAQMRVELVDLEKDGDQEAFDDLSLEIMKIELEVAKLDIEILTLAL